MPNKKPQKGFTIVELLIVIVVIAILAAISIVAYTGIQDRAKLSKTQSDFANTQKLIELHYAQYGHYPIVSPDWAGQSPSNKDTYIPGLVAEFGSGLPTVTDASGAYLYRSTPTGSGYKLIKYKSGGLAASEWSRVPASMKDQYVANMDRYGVWSATGASLWLVTVSITSKMPFTRRTGFHPVKVI